MLESASWGGSDPGGVYLVWGGLPGPGGVVSDPGGSAGPWGGGVVSDPGGSAWSRGGWYPSMH